MNIEFISYNGRYPNLCSGQLMLKIDGEVIDSIRLISGGSVWFDNDWCEHVETGDWSADNIPTKYESIYDEIIAVINENVPKGCCGGCV